jgi:hypothetical protein
MAQRKAQGQGLTKSETVCVLGERYSFHMGVLFLAEIPGSQALGESMN